MEMADIDIRLFYLINHLPHTGVINLFFLFFHYLTALGVGWLILWLILLLVDKARKRKINFGAFAVIVTWIIEGGIIKNLVHRPRPPAVLDNVIVGAKYLFSYSFPSGQVAVSFAVATVLVLLYPQVRYVYFVFAIPVLVGISRIYLGAHYPSDVLGGAAIGILIPYLIFHFFYKKFNLENLPPKTKI